MTRLNDHHLPSDPGSATTKDLRDEFAMAALSPLLANRRQQDDWPNTYATWAYEMADAMIKARDK